MDFNDGSQFRVLANVDAQIQGGRSLYAYRLGSMRDRVMYVDNAYAHHRALVADRMATVLYQYVWPRWATPEQQADFLLAAVDGLRTREMVCLDLEPGSRDSPSGLTAGNVAEFAHRWLARVEPALNTRAWLYIPSVFALPMSPVVEDRVVWSPHYSATPTWPHDAHQYTDHGFFPGCSQTGDVSRTNLTADQLLSRCNPGGFNEPPHGGHA